MEESAVPKRAREEPQVKEDDAVGYCEQSSKRHKPYNHILSLLESEEESKDSTQQDLSPLITTLQQEIFTCNSNSSSSHDDTLLSPSQNINSQLDTNLTTTTTTTTKSLDSIEDCSTRSIITFAATTTHSNGGSVLEEDDKVGLMRHLLEASDDELGIPNRGELEGSVMEDFGEDGFISGGDMFASSICDGLWELEDETANYYALLHSELFL